MRCLIHPQKQMRTNQMAVTGSKQSGPCRQRLCVLPALLFFLCLQPLHAQNTVANLSKVCGRTRFLGKIFDGQNANPEDWPWQASLFFNGTYVCGAALIDSNWVATAAHCIQRSHNPDDYRILLGYSKLSNPSEYSVQMSVSKLIVHPDFDKHHFLASDITLMQLHKPVKFNSSVLPACLPMSSTKPDPKISCWISGWEMTADQTNNSELLPPTIKLQEAEVSLLDSEDCNNYYRSIGLDTTDSKPVGVFEDMVCAEDRMNGTAICRGDSGGPLICPLEGVWYLFGLSSWSTECNIGPSVFTNLSYFSEWIQQHKQEASTHDSSMDLSTQKHSALSPVLKPRMTAVLSAQFLLLWLILVSAQ